MNNEEALSVIKNIIFEVNGTPVNDINPNDSLITKLAMDSVELIEFLIRLEEFGVKISESQLTDALTVERISQMIVK
ncbi:acyl carrier protein [Citrobacter sp. JGM124]|uniref:acyl carrier protein n=1 Tax=Citrobacter sp. JGM124 TaxID=2799789 RepID=UPI001BADD342|nr:acyl carrier protein [Citrobacter sp. JGM124]MBS0846936.1 acyl carrier protein [Citrobacter sp. JGM124]